MEQIRNAAQPLHHYFAAARIEQKAAIGIIFIVGKNIVRAGLSLHSAYFGQFHIELRAHSHWRTVKISQQNLRSDGPDAALSQHIALPDAKTLDYVRVVA